MPDLFQQVLLTEGILWLILAFSLAGVVRGFTGFGTAMIVVPVGAMFLPLAEIIFILTITGLWSAFALLPKAWPQSSKREVVYISLAAIVGLPFGIFLLEIVDQIVLRWALTGIVTGLLATLLAGWRYNHALSLPHIVAIGLTAGLVGGATGLTGPVVILFYLASSSAVKIIRANSIVFLGVLDVALAVMLVSRGLADWSSFLIAVVVGVPYVAMTILGQRLFDPEKEKLYRNLSYAIIAGVAIISMPLFD